MKVPSSMELQRFQRSLKAFSRTNYLNILQRVLLQWERVSGDQRPMGLFRARDFRGLFAYADELVVQQYPTAALHFAAHQLSALVRKYPWDSAEIGTDPEKKAIETFLAAEHRCKRQNQWFFALRRSKRPNEVHSSLARMRDWILYVLGQKVPKARIYELADYTGGASIGVHGNATHLAAKLLAEKWTVSAVARPIFAAALSMNTTYSARFGESQSGWSMDDLDERIDLSPDGVRRTFTRHVREDELREHSVEANYNKIAFVPKTAKTHRSIAVEPIGNGYLQKGVDLLMRHRLKRVGLDLSDQTLNQRLAREGSVDDSDESFCTIDLSSASDSIATELVREVLPPDWFAFLNRIRSPSFKLGEEITPYQKFCSMGNGFCFPLETLLFASIVHSVSPSARPGVDFVVYGDDIIVRKKIAGDVVSLLARLGFKTNTKKTCLSGPFRESCGANWYKGEDVTPFTLDFELDCLSSLFKFVNQARRNERSSLFLSECIGYVLQLIPDKFRFLRPFAGPPDSGIDPLDIEYPYKARYGYHRRWQTLTWLELDTRPVLDERRVPDWVVKAAVIRGASPDAPFTLRRKTKMRVRVIARSGPTIGFDPPQWLKRLLGSVS